MAPTLDWGKLMKVDPDGLPSQERLAEKMLKTLSQVNSSDLKGETNENLIQLFRITQSLMKVKSQEVEFVLEEAGKAAEEQVKTENQLRNKMKQLENEIEMAQLSTGTRDSRFLREEIRQLEEQLGQREREMKDTRKELEKEKQVNERLALRNEEADNENSKLRREIKTLKKKNEQLRQDVIDYQSQIDSQRESLMSRGEGQDYKTLISKKNMELVQYLDEIQSFSEANERLEAQNQEMTKNLEESVQEMEKMTDEYSKMKLMVQHSDSIMDQLRKEKEHYKLQVMELTEQIKAKNEEDDPVMIAVNMRVEEWKRILASKDEEIMEYQQMLLNLREKLKISELDADKSSVLALQQGLQERDNHIKMLTEQLEQHTKEMESYSLHIEDLKRQLQTEKGDSSYALHNRAERLEAVVHLTEQRLREAERVAELAENDARQKDKDLIDALRRMKEYETGVYGLEEAVAEIKEMKNQLRIRDREIETLTTDINKLEMKINDILDENEDHRERLGLDPKTVIDLTEFKNVKGIKQQQYRAENQVLLKEIERLEEERVVLKKQIRNLAQQRGKKSATFELTPDDLFLNSNSVTEFASKHKSSSLMFVDNIEEIKAKKERSSVKGSSCTREALNASELYVGELQNRTELRPLATEITKMLDSCLNDMHRNENLHSTRFDMRRLVSSKKEETRPKLYNRDSVKESVFCSGSHVVDKRHGRVLPSVDGKTVISSGNRKTEKAKEEGDGSAIDRRLAYFSQTRERDCFDICNVQSQTFEAKHGKTQCSSSTYRLYRENLEVETHKLLSSTSVEKKYPELSNTSHFLMHLPSGPIQDHQNCSAYYHQPTAYEEGEKNEALSRQFNDKERELERSRTVVAELKSKVKGLSEENKQFQQGMGEILQAIKDSQKDSSLRGSEATLVIPSLERLVHAFETKNSSGIFDVGVHLKAQVDQLTGRNEELRQELKGSRKEAAHFSNLLSKANEKISHLENEVTLLRQSEGANIVFKAVNLPEGLSLSSTNLISSMNEYLLHLLQEVESKEKSVVKLEEALEEYKRKLAVIRHQQGLIYKEYQSEQESWQVDLKRQKEQISKLESEKEQDAVQIKEYMNLVEALKMEPDEMKKLLAENSRKMTVLRVNEKSLTRRYTTLMEMEQHLRKENNNLKTEISDMETAVGERLGYLQRYKDIAAFKVASLQKALDDRVPLSELETANKQYNDLTAKYRDILQKDNLLVQRTANLEHLEHENNSLRSQITSYAKELEITKEKLNTLEQAWEHIGALGDNSAMDKARKAITNNEIVSISKKITMLEMKELNERQRAEHSHKMYEHLRITLKQVEERNFELESKFAELTRINIEAQKVEQALRDELANSVSKEVSNADRRRIMELEKSEAELAVEVSKLRSLSDIAKAQVSTLVCRQQSREKEVESLRKQVLDFQDQSDEKALIAKLHQQIVALQISESTAVAKLEATTSKLQKMEAHSLRLEQKMDDKEQALYYARLEGQNRAKHLRHTIQTLRRQFSGSLPLAQQEKFSKTLMELQTDKLNSRQEMQLLQQQRRDTETHALELELKLKGLEELIGTLKDPRGAQKVTVWHQKMEQMSLQDMKLTRELNQKMEEIKYLSNIISEQERTINNLEEELVQQRKFHEERQMSWDQREVELERQLDKYEQQQHEVLHTARKFEEATGEVPDSSLPLPQQLDTALRKIKEHVRTILETKSICRTLEEKLKEKEALLWTSEQNVLSRDKVINELRLRLPAVVDREKLMFEFNHKEDDSELRQALKVAHQTIENMQARLNQKEEVLKKYQHLLAKAREEQQESAKKHGEDLKALHEKLDLHSDASITKFKEAALELMKKPTLQVPSSTHLIRMAEMEQTVAERDASLSTLSNKLQNVTAELERQKQSHVVKINELGNSKARLEESYTLEVKKHKSEAEELRVRLSEMEKEMNYLNTELEVQKEANTRAPTATMKNLVERLKSQVTHKEKQQKALSKALLALRAEMTAHAEQQIISAAAQKEDNLNIQQIVDRQTKDLKARIEDLNEQLLKLKEILKSSKARENNLTEDLENLNQEMRGKQKIINKLHKEKDEVDKENEELKKRIKRLMSSTQSKSDLESKQSLIDELQKKVKRLEVELEKRTEEAERKPAQEDKSSKEEIIRWEEGKKWQSKLEGMRSKLRDKEKEVETLTKQLTTLKDLYSKADQEKIVLQKRLKSRGVTVDQVVGVRAGESEREIEDLRKKIIELENEISYLKTKQALPRDSVVDELHLKNQYLQEKIQILERQLSRENLSRPSNVAEDTEKTTFLPCDNKTCKPENAVSPNTKRSLFKRTKGKKTSILEEDFSHVDEHMKTLSSCTTQNTETNAEDHVDVSNPCLAVHYPDNASATAESENASDLADELCICSRTENATASKTPDTTPPAGNTPSPISCDASVSASGAHSSKPGDTSLPVSTTATPGLGDTSGIGSTQAIDEQESNGDIDWQNTIGTSSTKPSRTSTVQEAEESHHCTEEMLSTNEEMRELNSVNHNVSPIISNAKCPSSSNHGQQNSSNVKENEAHMDGKDRSENNDTNKANMDSDLRARQTSGIGSEDPSSRDTELQKENLRLSAENVELQFQLEQANKDLPRLKDQIANFKEMCDLLKKDKLEVERKLGNVRGSGRSGKTIPELEKTIGLMKRVVERVQRENEELKKAPGVLTNEKLSNLELENEKLKSELKKLQLHVGGQLSVRYEAKTKGMEKVIAENERLRKELKTETETSEKLRIAKRNLEVVNEKLSANLQETGSKLSFAESRGPPLEGADRKGWKSMTKMYETKMKEMEAELIKKNDSIVDLKRLLKEATERERRTEQTIQHLKDEIDLLKDFPKDANTDKGLSREFQILRLTNNRLENEKLELVQQLEMYNHKSATFGSDEVLDRDRKYNKLMEEVVDLQTHIKTSDLEKLHLKEEIKRMKKELENFDPTFFEEIEDLKYNYNEEVKKNIVLEEKLKALSQQFGVQIDIPIH